MQKKKKISSRKIIVRSLQDTHSLAAELIKQGVRFFALQGNLGSGKTAFAQGIAKALGIKRHITSPTFIIMNKHAVARRDIKYIYHIDLYRLESRRELELAGFSDVFLHKDIKSVIVVEWAEKARVLIPNDATWIHFQYRKNQNERSIEINFPPVPSP